MLQSHESLVTLSSMSINYKIVFVLRLDFPPLSISFQEAIPSTTVLLNSKTLPILISISIPFCYCFHQSSVWPSKLGLVVQISVSDLFDRFVIEHLPNPTTRENERWTLEDLQRGGVMKWEKNHTYDGRGQGRIKAHKFERRDESRWEVEVDCRWDLDPVSDGLENDSHICEEDLKYEIPRGVDSIFLVHSLNAPAKVCLRRLKSNCNSSPKARPALGCNGKRSKLDFRFRTRKD